MDEGQRPINILILEDALVIRQFVKKQFKLLLKEKVGRIDLAPSLAQARKCLLKNHYDICLIDLNLNGKIIGHEIIDDCIPLNIIPIVMTAINNEEIFQLCYQRGAFSIVHKDIHKIFIQNIINIALPEIFNRRIEFFFQHQFPTKYEPLRYQVESFLRSYKQQGELQQSVFITGTGAKKLVENIVDFLGDKIKKNKIYSLDQTSPQRSFNTNREKLPLFFFSENNKEDVLKRDDIDVSLKSTLLSALHIAIIPLEKRSSDILDYLKKNHKSSTPIVFSKDVANIIASYPWKNIQQIDFFNKNYIQNKKRRFISMQDLPSNMQIASVSVPFPLCNNKEESEEEIYAHFIAQTEKIITEEGPISFCKRLKQIICKELLAKNHGKIRKTAKELKMSPSTLLNILNQ